MIAASQHTFKMSAKCGVYGEEKKYIQVFGVETRRKETICKTYA
jgi:hypothetical protein